LQVQETGAGKLSHNLGAFALQRGKLPHGARRNTNDAGRLVKKVLRPQNSKEGLEPYIIEEVLASATYLPSAMQDLSEKNQQIYSLIWGADGVVEILRTSLGGAGVLPTSKQKEVPALYSCLVSGGNVQEVDAFVPGMVNLLVVKNTNTRAIIAQPFGPLTGTFNRATATDLFEQAMSSLLAGVIEHWYIDDWSMYHKNLGEVHCGTNVQRDLPFDKRWWDE